MGSLGLLPRLADYIAGTISCVPDRRGVGQIGEPGRLRALHLIPDVTFDHFFVYSVALSGREKSVGSWGLLPRLAA